MFDCLCCSDRFIILLFVYLGNLKNHKMAKKKITPLNKELHESGHKLASKKTSNAEKTEKAIILNLRGQVKKLTIQVEKLKKKSSR